MLFALLRDERGIKLKTSQLVEFEIDGRTRIGEIVYEKGEHKIRINDVYSFCFEMIYDEDMKFKAGRRLRVLGYTLGDCIKMMQDIKENAYKGKRKLESYTEALNRIDKIASKHLKGIEDEQRV